ncbi:MAG TPA: hypothetical protein VFE01_01240 [Terracidiphilus sp.]|nr:hypothetical protein [Terracidiphilus sp.]
MRLAKNEWFCAGRPVAVCLIGLACGLISYAQVFRTTTVQGTVYLADGRPGAGTLQLSWPAFTTANDQAVASGRTTVAIGADGFVSVNLAPNAGATPGGLYYTAVYYMSNGATSTEYCRNAATAISQAAASVTAMWSGTYKGLRTNFATDVWPGDALQLNAPSTNLNAQVVVRSVKLSYRGSYPDRVEYAIAFANDWADDLAIATSIAVPADTWLPAPMAPTFLANLSDLAVTALNGSTVTINTGATAPSGGGFEIRRRDFAFMPGEDPDLVMRGTQPNLTFSRTSASERYYIRMYDGASPPNYSEFSAAVFINLPLGS